MRILILATMLALSACSNPWSQHDCSQYEWLGNPNCK